MADQNKEKDPIDLYIEKAKRAESSGDPNAKNPNSSAKGLYQFTNSTWKDMEKKLGRKLSMDNVGDQEAAMKAFTKGNAEALQKNGLPVNDNNLYIVHHFGAKGGIDFLKKLDKNPNGLASNFISKDAVNANRSLFFNEEDKPVTGSELYNKLSNRIGNNTQPIDLQSQVNELVQNQPVVENNTDQTSNQQEETNYIPQDNSAAQKKELDRITNLTGILSPEEINNQTQPQNNIESTRKDLNLSSGNLDFLPKDANLIFEDEQDIKTNEAKYGGKQNPTEKNDILNEFNSGGSHEENTYGGIPQGVGSNGKMNTVQEGETKYKDYVFTNDLRVNEQDTKDLFLPEDIIGMTFADASKYINKIAEDNPYDKIIKKTVEKQNDSLILGNEKARLAKEQLDLNQGKLNINEEQDQFFLGGDSTELGIEGADPWSAGINDGVASLSSLMSGHKDQAMKSAIKGGFTVAGTAIGGPVGGMIGGAVGDLAGGLIGDDNDGKEEMKLGRRINSQFNDTYKMGGKLNKYKTGGRLNPITGEWEYDNEGTINNQDLSDSLLYDWGQKNNNQNTITLTDEEISNKNGNLDGYSNEDTRNKSSEDSFNPKGKDYLQYAPVLGSALNFLEDKKAKPEQEVLNRLGNRYKYNKVDENQLVNLANQSLNNQINSLSQTGASQGQLRSNIVGATAGRTQAISDSFMKSEDLNRQYEDKAQGFNLAVDQFNIEQNNKQREINAENKSVTEDRLRASQNALFTNIGSIGRENTYDNRLYNMTGGYDNMGKFDPESMSFLDKLLKGNQKTNESKFGGFMSKMKDVISREQDYNEMLKNI